MKLLTYIMLNFLHWGFSMHKSLRWVRGLKLNQTDGDLERMGSHSIMRRVLAAPVPGSTSTDVATAD